MAFPVNPLAALAPLVVGVGLFGTVAAPVLAAPTAGTGAASLYSGGDILTMAGPKPVYAEALVERGGRIV